MKASTLDLQNRTEEILTAVDRGETVHVLDGGKERAMVVPPAKGPRRKRSSADHPFCGMWADRKDMEDVEGWLRKIREPRYRDL